MNDAVIFIYGLCFSSLRFKNVKYTLQRNNLHRIKPAHRSAKFCVLFRHTPLFLLLPSPHQAPWCSSPIGQPHRLTARTTTVLPLDIARKPCEWLVLFLLLSSPLWSQHSSASSVHSALGTSILPHRPFFTSPTYSSAPAGMTFSISFFTSDSN